jgi:hypothetical protein
MFIESDIKLLDSYEGMVNVLGDKRNAIYKIDIDIPNDNDIKYVWRCPNGNKKIGYLFRPSEMTISHLKKTLNSLLGKSKKYHISDTYLLNSKPTHLKRLDWINIFTKELNKRIQEKKPG